MTSLYPSHIHIFHIFINPSSSSPVAMPLVFFFIFSFLWRGDGVCFSCGFLVLVLWMFFGLFLVPSLVSPFASFRRSPRLRFALRPVPPFRSSIRSPFRSSVRFSVWAGRGAVCGSRRFCQLFRAGGRLCFFVFWCRGGDVGGVCRIVDVVGSANGGAGCLCGAYSVPCGWALGVLLGEALGGA